MTFNIGLNPFAVKSSIFFVGVEYADIVQPSNGCGKDGIGLIMVENKETNAAVKRHEGEQPSDVVVDDTAILVCKRPKTEDICYGFIAIICDDIGGKNKG